MAAGGGRGGVAEGSKRVAGSGSGRGGKKSNTLGANVGAIITVTLVDFVGHEKKPSVLEKKALCLFLIN